MRTAYCFTPDRAFFAPALRAIASMVEAEPNVEREIFLICEPDDVPAGFDALPAPLRQRITLMTLDFKRFDLNFTKIAKTSDFLKAANEMGHSRADDLVSAIADVASTAREVADLICFAASEAAGYVTGASFDINGGDLMM